MDLGDPLIESSLPTAGILMSSCTVQHCLETFNNGASMTSEDRLFHWLIVLVVRTFLVILSLYLPLYLPPFIYKLYKLLKSD